MRTNERPYNAAIPATRAIRRSPHVGHAYAPRLRPQLLADGIVATYIHDISQRNPAPTENGQQPEIVSNDARAADHPWVECDASPRRSRAPRPRRDNQLHVKDSS